MSSKEINADVSEGRHANSLLLIAMLVCVVIEGYVHGFYMYSGNKTVAAVIYVITGIGVAILPLLMKRTPMLSKSPFPTYLSWILLLWGLLFFIVVFSRQLPDHPLDHKIADMIPVMKVMANRFIHGYEVYSQIPEIWNGMQPIYLPAFWLPLVVSELFGFDPRWVVFSLFLLAFFIALQVWQVKRSFASVVLILPAGIVAFTCIAGNDTAYTLLTQEGIAVFYYVLLGYALTRRNPYFVGLAAALCLMSRFSLVFWIFGFFIYLTLNKNFRYLVRAITTGAIVTLFLMTITGAIAHLDVFLGLDRVYLNALRPNNDWKIEPLLTAGLGLARFWEYDNLRQLYYLFYVLNLVVPLIGFLIFRLPKLRSVRNELLPLCILKLSLVTFYNLMFIPAGYLFYTSTVLSLVIVYVCLNPGSQPGIGTVNTNGRL